MRQKWEGENNWLVPPPVLISNVVKKLLKEKVKATLVIPVWKSAPFWPLLVHHENIFISNISDFIYFEGNDFTHRGYGKNGIFGKKIQRFSFVALRFNANLF